MPLMAKLPDEMAEKPVHVQLEVGDQKLDLVSEENNDREEKDSGYEDFDGLDDEPFDSDMEGSNVHRPRPRKVKPPVVPQRSDKRASRNLDSVMMELKALAGHVPAKDTERFSVVGDPHELYLSSEEDASLSDFEDTESLVDLTPTENGLSQPPSRPSSRRSQEDTARVVSFTLVTKPQIIQINIPPPTSNKRRHPVSLEGLAAPTTHSTTSYIPSSTSYIPTTRRPPPLKLYPVNHRLSMASTTSSPMTVHSNTSLQSLPPRKSSKLNLHTLVSTAKNSFLTSDPFASPQPQIAEHEEFETPVTPKTPTSIAAFALKKSLSRSMGKRKPSLPKLDSANEGEKDGSRLARELAKEESREAKQRMGQSHETIPNAAEGWNKPMEKERKMSMGHKMSLSMGLARKKSVKGRGDRYLS